MRTIIFQLLILLTFYSCNDSEYPNSYKYSSIEINEIGVFVLNQNLKPVEILLFTTDELETIKSNLINELETNVLIQEVVIESSETATLKVQDEISEDIPYVNNDGILTFEMQDGVFILELTANDKLKFCTEFYIATKGPLTPTSHAFNYNSLNLNSCEELLTMEESVERIAHNYYHLDTFLFAFPKFVYE